MCLSRINFYDLTGNIFIKLRVSNQMRNHANLNKKSAPKHLKLTGIYSFTNWEKGKAKIFDKGEGSLDSFLSGF